MASYQPPEFYPRRAFPRGLGNGPYHKLPFQEYLRVQPSRKYRKGTRRVVDPFKRAGAFPFLKLPPEIRIMIYKMVLPGGRPIRLIGPKTHSARLFSQILKTRISLFLVSKLVHDESRAVFFDQNSTRPHLGIAPFPKFHGYTRTDLFGVRSLEPHYLPDLARFRDITLNMHVVNSLKHHVAGYITRFCGHVVERQRVTGKAPNLRLILCACFFQKHDDGGRCARIAVLRAIVLGIKRVGASNCRLIVNAEFKDKFACYMKEVDGMSGIEVVWGNDYASYMPCRGHMPPL